MYLFCIPHAGGTMVSYLKWKEYITQKINLKPLELPGHMTRVHEPLLTEYEKVIQDLKVSMVKVLKKDEASYAIWGHSMGAELIYYLYQELRNENLPLPCHVFVSGRWAPSVRKKANKVEVTDEDAFEKMIVHLGGTDESILQNENMRNLMMGIAKADFTMMANIPVVELIQPFDCNLSFFYGTEDQDTNALDIEAWRAYTLGSFSAHGIEGGHFFPFTNVKDTLSIINQELERAT